MKSANSDRFWTVLHVAWSVIVVLTATGDLVALCYSLLDRTVIGVSWTVLQSLWRVVLWIPFWYAGFYALVAASRYFATRRVYGSISAEKRSTMALLADISQTNRVVRGGRVLLVLGGLLGTVSALALLEYRLMFIPVFAAVCLVWLWIRVSMPPFLVFLGTSSPRGVSLHHSFKRAVAPVRVVSLLALETSQDQRIKSELHLDCLRTNVDKEWFDVIEILLEMTPLIAMDASVVTPALDQETEHILNNDLAHKCIFFSSSFPSCPVLDRRVPPASKRRGALCCVPDPVAVATSAEARRNNDLPAQSNPITLLSRAVESKLPRYIERQTIAQVDSFFGKPVQREVACTRCDSPMFIITGTIVRTTTMQHSQGCFQCATCGTYTCYECSDSRTPCHYCGAQQWIEKAYLPQV